MDLPHKIIEQRERVRRAYGLMADETSQQEFLREMRWRMDLDLTGPPPMEMSDHHFPTDLLKLSGDDVLFDCGAFDGDTLLQFLELTKGRFKKIIALEPDPQNYEKLRRCVAALPVEVKERVELHKVAVGARAETLRFNAEGLASSGFDASGCTEVEAIPLDAFVGREHPTYIKMDIEGAEMDALRGGGCLIRESRPTLAICVYHCPDHLWEIPLAIAAFSPAYGLHLRRYAEIPWELVCYGIP
jgi:FkbM family methyltransferase